MGRIRILRRQDKSYIELPQEMAGEEELELFRLKDGYYLLSLPLGGKAPAEARREAPAQAGREQISEREREVLRKLLSIKFENRIPAYVNKALTESDKEVLGELERRGLVNVFRGKKYTEGVYNIRDSIYPILANKGTAEPRQPPQQPSGRQGSISLLRSQGFLIVQDKREAMGLSEQLGPQMKSGQVIGVKGFDSKFYIVTRDYFSRAEARIAPALKEDMDAPSIASETKLDPEGCMAVLRIMAENGQIIEKKKGVFAPV
jgi:hypothetical protein